MELPAMGATTHLPPLCRRLLFKFHRLLHDRSALCLLRIQGRGPDVRPSTDKRWETPIYLILVGPLFLAPVPILECGPWTL